MRKFIFQFGLFILIGLLIGAFTTYYLTKWYNEEQARATLYSAGQYLEKKEYARAVALLNQAIVKDPNNYAPYYSLGTIYYKGGDSMLALEMYSIALEKSGDNKHFDFDRKQIRKKIDELKRLIRSEPAK
jgi:Tfp pilus assembly protein PilF